MSDDNVKKPISDDPAVGTDVMNAQKKFKISKWIAPTATRGGSISVLIVMLTFFTVFRQIQTQQYSNELLNARIR